MGRPIGSRDRRCLDTDRRVPKSEKDKGAIDEDQIDWVYSDPDDPLNQVEGMPRIKHGFDPSSPNTWKPHVMCAICEVGTRSFHLVVAALEQNGTSMAWKTLSGVNCSLPPLPGAQLEDLLAAREIIHNGPGMRRTAHLRAPKAGTAAATEVGSGSTASPIATAISIGKTP